MTEKNKLPVKAGSPVMAIVPKTIDEAYRFASGVAGTPMVPLIGSKQNRRPMNAGEVMAVVMAGMEVGLPPMAALRSIAFFNGRAAFWGDGQLAVIQSRPDFGGMHEHYNDDDQTATCEVTRMIAGQPHVTVRSFSMKQAERANLANKPGPWQEYPERMLQHRARGWALRDAFSDALMGIMSEAEARDTPPDDIELITGDVVEDLPEDPTPYEEVEYVDTDRGDGDSEAVEPETEAEPADEEPADDEPDETEPPETEPDPAVGKVAEAVAWTQSKLTAVTTSNEAVEVFNKGGAKEKAQEAGPIAMMLIKAMVATYRDFLKGKLDEDTFAKRVAAINLISKHAPDDEKQVYNMLEAEGIPA